MRHLLHFGLFALALSAVTQADAQDRRRGDRHTTIVVAPEGDPRMLRPVRSDLEPTRAVYDSRRRFPETPRAAQDARRNYSEEREDLTKIIHIRERWEQASANRNRKAQLKINRRLDAWLDREIRESIRSPRNQRYTQRVRGLSYELQKLDRRARQQRKYSGHGYHDRGYANRGHGHGHGGRGYGNHAAKKGRILDELVELSERQLRRAEAKITPPFRLSFARR